MTKTVVFSAFQTDGTPPPNLHLQADFFGNLYGSLATIEPVGPSAWQHAERAGTHVVRARTRDPDAFNIVSLQFDMPEAGYFTYWAARALVPSQDPNYTVNSGTVDQSDDEHPAQQMNSREAHDWTQFWVPLGPGQASMQWVFVGNPDNAISANEQWLSRFEAYTGDDLPPGLPADTVMPEDLTLDVTPESVGTGSSDGGGPAPAAYGISDLVKHRGGLYLARVPSPTTEPLGDSDEWAELVAPSAASAPRSYVHEQGEPAMTWLIQHRLGYYPAVTIVDSAGQVVEGTLTYLNLDEVQADFGGDFSGRAFAS